MDRFLDIIAHLSKKYNIGTKVIGATALTGITDAQIGGADLDFPTDAQTLLGVIPVYTSPAGNTAAEAQFPVMTLSSKSTAMQLGDCTFLGQPIGSSLLKSTTQVQGKMADVGYAIFASIPVGAKLKVYGHEGVVNTIHGYMGAIVYYTDADLDTAEPGQYPQVHWVVGTFTSTGAPAAEVIGSKLAFTGARRIIEVGGVACGTTVAALKGIMAKCRLNSPDILFGGDIEFFLNPISGQVDTNIQEANPGVTRLPVSIPVKTPATLRDYCALQVALTTAGTFALQVGYI